jgi:hypothetical protein
MHSFTDIIAARRHTKTRERFENELASLSTAWSGRITKLYTEMKTLVLDSAETNIEVYLEVPTEELTHGEVEEISYFISARREIDPITPYSMRAWPQLSELEDSIRILGNIVEHEGMELEIWTKRKLIAKKPVLVSIRIKLSV